MVQAVKNNFDDTNVKMTNTNGFTLIEVLIAMTMLLVGMLSLVAMQTSAVKGNNRSDLLTKRIIAGSNHIETLLCLSFDDPVLAAGSHDNKDDNKPKHLITWDIVDLSSDKKSIAVTIAENTQKQTKSLTIKTIRIR